MESTRDCFDGFGICDHVSGVFILFAYRIGNRVFVHVLHEKICDTTDYFIADYSAILLQKNVIEKQISSLKNAQFFRKIREEF